MRKLIPEQIKGKSTNAKDCVILSEQQQANEAFAHACARMLNVNEWHEYSGFASARFIITDTHGNECKRAVQKGDYIKIDIPGPGPHSGGGYDWVIVEAIESNADFSTEQDFCGMMVRAANNPLTNKSDTAHFFTSDATSTFIIKKNTCTVTSFYYGRNEELNVGTKKVLDKVRNAVIGSMGMAGISELQWKRLINSFLAAFKK